MERGLARIFRRRRVRFAYVFGSRGAAGRPRPDSDHDFAVRFAGRRSEPRHTALWLDLVRYLRTDAVDLVDVDEADLVLRWEILRTGRLVYEADREARIAFEFWTRKCAWDEAFHWAVYDAELSRRIRSGAFGRRDAR